MVIDNICEKHLGVVMSVPGKSEPTVPYCCKPLKCIAQHTPEGPTVLV